MDGLQFNVIASGSTGNCYTVYDGETGLLIEAGIPIIKIKQSLGFGLSTVSGVLISHEHMDHAKAVKDLMKCGIDVYMSAGTAAALDISGHRLHVVGSGEVFEVGSYEIMAFQTKHDAREPLGYFIQSRHNGLNLLFFTDTNYLEYIFEDVDYIMAECNYSKAILSKNFSDGVISKALYERIYRSHMSLETLKEFLKAMDLKKLKQIYLLHLSDTNSDAVLFKEEIQRLTGAEVITT